MSFEFDWYAFESLILKPLYEYSGVVQSASFVCTALWFIGLMFSVVLLMVLISSVIFCCTVGLIYSSVFLPTLAVFDMV
jgi:hypothetical protein